MKKKVWIWIIAAIALIAVLVVPIPSGAYKDGGTREYTALTYKIVDWNRLTPDTVYEKTSVYLFPNNFKSIDALWEQEEEYVEQKFQATVIEINQNTALVEPLADESERLSSDRIELTLAELEDIGAEVGSVVEVTYTGGIVETYPARVNAVSWEMSRYVEYTEQWLDKTTAEKYDRNIFSDIVITRIYSNCFFARTVSPMPYEIKLNGTLSEKWCIGDQVAVTYENGYYDQVNQRFEADVLTVEASDFELGENTYDKPVIYLYPEVETEVSVRLTLDGDLTCTYPAYQDGWKVTASPDGTLTDANGQSYNYLYWEGKVFARYDMTKGFCVKGEDTAVFLEKALADLGLTRREANEFIVYWLPLMQNNPYNIISFQTDAYTNAAKLEIDPAPDTLIRVFMVWQATDSYVETEEQHLTAPARTGFTVVEWGGTQIGN